jgi:NAD(P)-dependent dehydrogenase (short-subunit alcohol dehydrogenase family)
MRNLFSVEGKVALVTGGSRGIGEMIARGYVENGAKVYVSSRKAEVCDRVAEELSQYGTCISLPFDLSNMAGITGLAAAVAERESKLGHPGQQRRRHLGRPDRRVSGGRLGQDRRPQCQVDLLPDPEAVAATARRRLA